MSDSALKRKLVLNRETLVPLQDDELHAVNGGTGVFCASARSVWASIKAVSALYSSYKASQEVTRSGQQ
jgi:hypothetical protein